MATLGSSCGLNLEVEVATGKAEGFLDTVGVGELDEVVS